MSSKLVSPVARFLGTADASRCSQFYKDVLGFEIRQREEGFEAIQGPARLLFGSHDHPPLDWENPRPPGSAIVFFETNDVDGLHAAFVARGAKATAPENVNWIKMRMFEVRDPDGHALWFGQSDDQPHEPRKNILLEKALPELALTDVAAGVAHYRDVLGFHINYQQEDLGVMDRDEVTLLLIQRTPRHAGISSAEFYIANADALFAEFRSRGANIQGEPVSHPWGLRTFSVLDLEGNRLTFAQPFE